MKIRERTGVSKSHKGIKTSLGPYSGEQVLEIVANVRENIRQRSQSTFALKHAFTKKKRLLKIAPKLGFFNFHFKRAMNDIREGSGVTNKMFGARLIALANEII